MFDHMQLPAMVSGSKKIGTPETSGTSQGSFPAIFLIQTAF
jgi:hypothetical protein